MGQCEALFIGGSAGALDVLLQVLPGLEANLPFPIVLVLHRKPGKDSLLTDLLRSKTRLLVKEAEEKEELHGGVIYIAPPDYHLLTEDDGTISLDASEKVNFSRPSIDVSFESAAEVFAEGLVCILLSGSNSDGTLGLQTVKKAGGKIIIQKPSTAVASFMPQYAAQNVEADALPNPTEMSQLINELAK